MTTWAWIMLIFAICFLGGGFWFASKRAAKSDKDFDNNE